MESGGGRHTGGTATLQILFASFNRTIAVPLVLSRLVNRAAFRSGSTTFLLNSLHFDYFDPPTALAIFDPMSVWVASRHELFMI